MFMSGELQKMAEQVKAGQEVKITGRALLSLFGMYRRTSINVFRIRRALQGLGLVTSPDFEGTYIDDLLQLRVMPPPPQVNAGEQIGVEKDKNVESQQQASVLCLVPLPDPAHRISRLTSANRPPLSIPPDGTVEQAVTIMLRYDYSQLPVMQTSTAREVKGLFSWKSLGSRLAIGRSCARVADSMDDCQVIPSNASLFDAIKIIAKYDVVLVQGTDRVICGIVTASDISEQFQQLAEPFLLLGDIESHVRYLVGNAFTVAELNQVKDPADSERSIQDVSDLTFGEYVRLLQNEDNWLKLRMRIDRKTFTGWLDKIRLTRNDVMHFDPDPLDPEDIQLLREFASFLNRWQQITSENQPQVG
jgi:CBS domain-containing protein